MNNIAFIEDVLRRFNPPDPVDPNAALGGGMPPIGGDDASRYFGLGISNPSQEALPPIGGAAPVNWDAQKYKDFAAKYDNPQPPPLYSPGYQPPPAASTAPVDTSAAPEIRPDFVEPRTEPYQYETQNPTKFDLKTAYRPEVWPQQPEIAPLGETIPEREVREIRGRDYTKPVWRNTDVNDKANYGKETSNRKEKDRWGDNVQVVTPEGKDRNKKWSIWEKLAAGALGYLGGGGFLGAIQAGSDRNYFQKLRDQRILGDALPKIEMQQQMEKKQADLENVQNQIGVRNATAAGTLANQASQIKDRDAKNKLARERWQPMQRNGKWVKHFADHDEPLLNEKGEQETDPTKIPIARRLKDNTLIYTTGDKALDQEIAQTYREAQFAMEKGKFDATTLNKYEADLDDWATKEQLRIQKNNADADTSLSLSNQAEEFKKQADGIAQQIAEVKQQPTPNLATERAAQATRLAALEKEERDHRAKAADLKKQSDVLINTAAGSKPTPKPTRPTGTFEAPSLGGGGGKTVTRAQLEAFAKSTNRTPAQAEAYAKGQTPPWTIIQ